MALPKIEGLITVPTGGWSVGVVETYTDATTGNGTATVAAGSYYPITLVSALQTALAAAVSNANATYSVALDDNGDAATGKVTITASGALMSSVALTWTSTSLRDALGFAANVSGALTYTGPNQATHLWLPNVPRANPLAPEPTSTAQEFGAEEADFSFTMSPSGYSRRFAYSRRYVDSFEWIHLSAAKTWIVHETVTNESLQKFYRDVLSVGTQIRYYPDRSSDALYFALVVTDADKFKPTPVTPGFVGAYSRWSVAYEVRKAL